jgi:hypothetical protein
MKALSKRFVLGVSAAGCLSMLLAAAPAAAGSDVAWRVYPDSLPPAQRAQALAAPLGHFGPFGEPAMPGCMWSRVQVPSIQGLQWVDEENCNNQGSWDW